MTENEIIKAMDYCCGNIVWEEDAECTERVCYQSVLPEDRDGDTRWCRQWLIKDALDLINRQKAEIERLTQQIEEYPFKCKVSHNSEIHSKSQEDYIQLIKDISNEAIKEFAERLKTYKMQPFNYDRYLVPLVAIDEVVKEMVGDNN